MKKQQEKEILFESTAKLASSFGACARLKILYLLAQAPRSVENIAQITGESIANTSQHLKRLFHEKLVCVRKDKLSRIYSLSNEKIALHIEGLFALSESLALDANNKHDDETEDDMQCTQSIEAIMNAVKNKKAILIDVREDYEAKQSPVANAISIPLANLKKAASTLAKHKTYFLFCRGRACDMASTGVVVLRSLGLSAYRLLEHPAMLRMRERK